MPTFKSMKNGYANMWASCELQAKDTVLCKKVAAGIIKDRARYEAVSAKTGVPWEWIACVHQRESGRNWKAVLHNGQKIVGTGKKTTIEPKDRGPFATWEEAAIDALEYDGQTKVKDWSVPRMLYEFEEYNGWGYLKHGENSPYVWASTNHEQLGKYTSDGKYNSKVDDVQLGCAAVLKSIYAQIGEEKPIGASKPSPVPTTPVSLASLLGVFLRFILSRFKRK